MKASIRRTIGATVLAAVTASASWRAIAGQAPPTADVAQIVSRDLQQLTEKLNDAAARQDDRDEAARRLVSRQTPEARHIVAQALENLKNPGGQLAVARALADDPQPDPAMINPLFATLGTNRNLTEAAARALANYKANPEVLTRLIDFVQRRPPSEAARVAVIRAIGTLPDKRAAQFLVEFMANPEESVAVRDACSAALAELSGSPEDQQGVVEWQQWWTGHTNQSNEEFRSDMMARRSLRYDQLREHFAQLSSEIDKIINEQYRLAPTAQRPEILQSLLRSAEPEVRAIAANIVKFDALVNKPPAAAVREQLREMIGDSSPAVRAAVADALAKINDAASLESLMAQLTQEPDPNVRAKLALALAPINDIRAVPELLAMLKDPSVLAAKAAAEALKQLGPTIRDTDPALAQRAAGELRIAIEERASTPDTADFREKILDAMVPLRQNELRETFTRLLDGRRGEGVEVRRLALKGIGEIASGESAAVIMAALTDRSERVRLEAVQALAKNPGLVEASEALRQVLDPQQERDESIRDAAWKALQIAFPQLSKATLNVWADRFKTDPGKRLLAQRALADLQLRDKDEDDLATTRQNLGETCMELQDYESAAEYFRLSLDYKKRQSIGGPAIANLISKRLNALLKAKDYASAVAFGAAVIKEDPTRQGDVGAIIVTEAEILKEASELKAALELIAQAKQMDPRLDEKYQDRLDKAEQGVQQRLREQNQSGPPAGPQSASRAPGPTSRTAATGN